MKHLTVGCLAAAVGLCALRWADLALWTDPVTGLVTAGAVWQRYLVLAAAAVICLAVGCLAGGDCPEPLRRRQPAAALPAAVGAAVWAVQGVMDIVRPAGFFQVVQGVLALGCGVWLGYLALCWFSRKERYAPGARLGIAGSLIFVVNILSSFMTNGSSWHRVAPTAAVWQQLAALLFLAALLRALCVPRSANGTAVCRYGLLAFCLCLCWQLPQCILLASEPGDWALMPIGLLGGVCALLCTRTGQRYRGSHSQD